MTKADQIGNPGPLGVGTVSVPMAIPPVILPHSALCVSLSSV